MASGAASERHAVTLGQTQDTRARARQVHARTVRVAEAVAITRNQVAALMEELATTQPQHAFRLRALSEQARKQGQQERDRAHGHARAALRTANGTAQVPGQRAARGAGARAAAISAQSALWELVDGFGDGVALVDRRGFTARASRRLETTFGYLQGELAGCPVEDLVPPGRREAHGRLRSAYTHRPRPRLSDDRAMLTGLRKDGTVFPVEISLSAVRSTAGPLTLALVRRTAEPPLTAQAADAEAPAAGHAACRGEMALLDRVVTGLFSIGLSLQTDGGARGVSDTGGADLLALLDGVIKDVRDHVFCCSAAASSCVLASASSTSARWPRTAGSSGKPSWIYGSR